MVRNSVKKFHPTLIKIISAFALVTVLPIVIIVAFFYPQNHRILNDTVQHSLSDYAENTTEILDKEWEAIYRAGIDLKSALIYRFLADDSDYRKAAEIQQFLQTACSCSELVERVLLLNPDSQQMYANSGTVNKDYFMDELYCFEGEDGEKFLSSLTEQASVFYASGFSYESSTSPSPYTLISFPISSEYG